MDRKEAAGVLDYDDLLLYWHALLADPEAGPKAQRQFDCVLVDEYQDTNALQADILYLLSPEGKGLTVVGDDAQSIYSFRAATVRNILDFPRHYAGATIVTLEQNYRSTCPILEATNRVIGLAAERYRKNLWSERIAGQRPALVTCQDEDDQTAYVIRRILEHREEGIDLRRQAVLFRASHHSILLEAELTGRKIPFHKYGGLKFVETAHVKDLLGFLRLAENPRDVVSGGRVLLLLPGIGPGKARQVMELLLASGGDFAAWESWKPPAAAAALWPKLVGLLKDLAATREDLSAPAAPGSQFLHAAPGSPLRPRPAAAARLGATRADRRPLSHAGTDAAGNGPRPAQFDSGPGRSAPLGRRLPGAEHDPLGQGPGMGRRLRDSCRRRQHPFRHGHQGLRRDRGRAAVVLRGPDAGEKLSLRLLPAALLPLAAAGRERPSRLCAADPLPARFRGACFDRRLAHGPDNAEDDDVGAEADSQHHLTSRAVRNRTKDLWR